MAREVSLFQRRVAWGLSLAGVVPFAALTAMLFFYPDATYRGYAALVLTTYGAVILSFLGGTRWGAVINGGERMTFVLVAAMAPPLLGWFALALPLPFPYLAHAAGFGLAAIWDWDAGRRGLFQQWYVSLRMTITAFVISCLILAATAQWTGTV